MAPCSCVSTGQEKHLTWHLEMLKDSLPRPEAGRKEPMMLSQTRVLNARRGGFAWEFWPQSSGENSRTSVLAPVRGLRLSFVWNGLISFWSDMIFSGLQDNLLRLYIRVAVILRRTIHAAECILNSEWQDGASWASWVGDANFLGFWVSTRWWQNTS